MKVKSSEKSTLSHSILLAIQKLTLQEILKIGRKEMETEYTLKPIDLPFGIYYLIKKNKPLDSLLVKESERLIRTQRYINRVDISPKLIPNSPDSVDVNIRVLDSWSLIPQGSIQVHKSHLN